MEALESPHEQINETNSPQSQICEENDIGQMQCHLSIEPEGCQTRATDCKADQAVLDTEIQCSPKKTDIGLQQYGVPVQIIQLQDIENQIQIGRNEPQQSQNYQYETKSRNDHYDVQQGENDQTGNECQNEHIGTQSQSGEWDDTEILSQTEQSDVEDQYDQHDTQSQCSQDDEQCQNDQFDGDAENNQYQEAEEIVKKLCKNGKVMQFQEGDDFIKVIVYEDSEETVDPEETLSAEETESTTEGLISEGRRQQTAELDNSKNLLDCLLANEKENMQQISIDCGSDSGPGPCKRSRSSLTTCTQGQILEVVADPSSQVMQHNTQWYQELLTPSAAVTSAVTPASAIQTNFAHTVNQFAPSFLTCNVADLDPVGTATSQPEDNSKDKQRVYTPHPRNGYMFYVPEEMSAPDGLSRSVPLATSSPAFRSNGPKATPRYGKAASVSQSSVHLNSSGEENVSPKELMDTPTSSHARQQLPKKLRSLIQYPEHQIEDLGKIREQHNQKERKRRARIKEACNLLRQLVPGMSDKTDKATVFEFAARYVHFLKSHTGSQFDKDFLMKYSPY